MTDQGMSALRRRMIEDMSLRKLTPGTQHTYVRFVKEFSIFFGRSRDKRPSTAEAPAKFDTSELTTGMTAAFTHDGNSRNAVSASRLAPPSVALLLGASCILLDSTISHPHCWRDRSVTAGVRHCSSATSTRGRERWHLAVRS
jgi:hypothetical protein